MHPPPLAFTQRAAPVPSINYYSSVQKRNRAWWFWRANNEERQLAVSGFALPYARDVL
jgi:hypothetical protein